MTSKRVVRFVSCGVGAVVLAGLAAPYLDAEGYRERIQSALERSLNRKVKVGKVRFNLLTGPGFKVSDVVISDDPSIGVEPLAYVESLEARVQLSRLWSRNPAFSNLKMRNPVVNLIKSDSGVWNFQLLNTAGDLPSIQVREGRINFKFGDTKSVFYLSESDLDVTPLDGNRVDVRFAGQPARTDQAAQSFGQLLARGIWKRGEQAESEIELNAELERSGLSDIAKLIEGRGIGIHGLVESKAHISGPVSNLAITGQLKLDDVHRWDLIQRGGASQLNYRGVLDLKNQRLELETPEKENPGLAVVLRFRASELLSNLRWATSVDFHDLPADAALEAARHMGAAVPAGMQAEGKLNGAVTYTLPGGLQGTVGSEEATVRPPGGPPLRFKDAKLLLDAGAMRLEPSKVEAENGQTAELAGEYDLGSRTLDIRLNTAGLSVAEFRKMPGAAVPALRDLEQGVVKGSLRYQRTADAEGAWTGDVDLRDARFEFPGLAEPVSLANAAVSISGARVTLARMRGKAGAIRFNGEYRAGNLILDIPEADLSEIERILMPTLQRKQDLLSRFRLRAPAAPDWLRERKLTAAVRIGKLLAAGQEWQINSATLDWNGTQARIANLSARQGDVLAEGAVLVDLAGFGPAYRGQGKVGGLAWKGGAMALDAKFDTRGTGVSTLSNARAEGTFEGENVAFAPEADFKTVTGEFDWTAPSKLRVRNLQAAQGFETLTGQGATQADGKLVLDLTSGRRQVKAAGTLSAAPGRELRP